MSRACYQTEKPGGERTVISNVVRMLAQEFRSQSYQIVQSTSGLQGGSCRNDTHNDEHHVERDIAGFQSEYEYEDEYAHHTVDSETDTPHARTDKNQCKNNEELNDNECSSHKGD